MERPARLFLCAGCRVQVVLCSHCDPGNRYCSRPCWRLSRNAARRDAVHRYLLETALKTDVALVAARRADYHGNLEYALTARNFNPLMAMAGTSTIAEAEDIVAVGMIPPDVVVTPGVLVRNLAGRELRA